LLSPAESRKAALSSISSTMQTARLRPALNTQVVPSRSNHDPSGNESRLMPETRDHLDERDPFAQAPRRGRSRPLPRSPKTPPRSTCRNAARS
jgi:hypothetical protein